MTVDPVVVIPDVDSKIASTRLMSNSENKKGNDPNIEIEIQEPLVKRKACLNSRCSDLLPLEERYNPAPTKSVIKEDAKNAGQSLLFKKKSGA